MRQLWRRAHEAGMVGRFKVRPSTHASNAFPLSSWVSPFRRAPTTPVQHTPKDSPHPPVRRGSGEGVSDRSISVVMRPLHGDAHEEGGWSCVVSVLVSVFLMAYASPARFPRIQEDQGRFAAWGTRLPPSLTCSFTPRSVIMSPGAPSLAFTFRKLRILESPRLRSLPPLPRLAEMKPVTYGM